VLHVLSVQVIRGGLPLLEPWPGTCTVLLPPPPPSPLRAPAASTKMTPGWGWSCGGWSIQVNSMNAHYNIALQLCLQGCDSCTWLAGCMCGSRIPCAHTQPWQAWHEGVRRRAFHQMAGNNNCWAAPPGMQLLGLVAHTSMRMIPTHSHHPSQFMPKNPS
jgi:hypothetical protein